MKKLSLLILSLLLTLSFSLHSITCYATGGSVTVNGASAKAGDEVTVEINASDIKGVNSGSIEVKSLPEGVTVIDGKWSVNAKISAFDPTSTRGVFALDEKQDIEGAIFKLKLKLGASAESGDIVCEVRFKDGSAGNPDVAGVENIPGKLTVLSAGESTGEDGKDAGNNDASGDTENGGTDGENGGNSEGGDGEDGGNEQLSPIVIVLIAVAGTALIAAIVLIITKKRK